MYAVRDVPTVDDEARFARLLEVKRSSTRASLPGGCANEEQIARAVLLRGGMRRSCQDRAQGSDAADDVDVVVAGNARHEDEGQAQAA